MNKYLFWSKSNIEYYLPYPNCHADYYYSCCKWFADQHEIIIVIDNVVKIYLQVKNQNKKPFISVFPVIFKDQCLEIFRQKYLNNMGLSKLPPIEYKYQCSIIFNIRSYLVHTLIF